MTHSPWSPLQMPGLSFPFTSVRAPQGSAMPGPPRAPGQWSTMNEVPQTGHRAEPSASMALLPWLPQYRLVWDRLLGITEHPSSVLSQGYREGSRGGPTLSPSQERDPLPPTCHTALEYFKIRNHTKLCLMAILGF